VFGNNFQMPGIKIELKNMAGKKTSYAWLFGKIAFN
jgi:hypothetical protein